MSEPETTAEERRQAHYEFTIGLAVLDPKGPFADLPAGEVKERLADGVVRLFFDAGWRQGRDEARQDIAALVEAAEQARAETHSDCTEEGCSDYCRLLTEALAPFKGGK